MLDEVNVNSLEIVGDVIALNSIVNNNSFINVPSDGHLCLRTGQFIELSPGFETLQGSELSAHITEVTECGEPDGEDSNYNLGSGDGGLDQVQETTNFEPFIYPNPTTDKAILTFSNMEAEKVIITLYDYSGQLIKTIIAQTLGIGTYQQAINCSELLAGTYFLKIKQGKKDYKIIKIMKL